jgi:hypothetical protein
MSAIYHNIHYANFELTGGWVGYNTRVALMNRKVSKSRDGLAVSTRGAACGEIYTVLALANSKLRNRVASTLKVGLEVHLASARAI